jgi:hypothetical protein
VPCYQPRHCQDVQRAGIDDARVGRRGKIYRQRDKVRERTLSCALSIMTPKAVLIYFFPGSVEASPSNLILSSVSPKGGRTFPRMTVGDMAGRNQSGSPITIISNIYGRTYINTVLECNSSSQANGHVGAFSPFRKKVNEDLPDKGEFCAFFIRADPFANQPSQAAFEDSVTSISDRT